MDLLLRQLAEAVMEAVVAVVAVAAAVVPAPAAGMMGETSLGFVLGYCSSMGLCPL